MSDKPEGASFNDFVICPIDKSHRLLKGRLAKHLTRCGRTHDKTKKFLTCPFNTDHRFIAAEMEDHKKVCENRVDIDVFKNDEKPSSSRTTALPPLPAVECEEDWDLEPDVKSYNPQHHCETNLIIRSLKGCPRSVRREFRESERRRFKEMQN